MMGHKWIKLVTCNNSYIVLNYLANKYIAFQEMSSKKLRRSASCVLNTNTHFGALFGDFLRLMIVLNTCYSTEIDEFLIKQNEYSLIYII
jgi:putative flippase GtrA